MKQKITPVDPEYPDLYRKWLQERRPQEIYLHGVFWREVMETEGTVFVISRHGTTFDEQYAKSSMP